MDIRKVVLLIFICFTFLVCGYAQRGQYKEKPYCVNLECSPGLYVLSQEAPFCPSFKLNVYWVIFKKFKVGMRDYAKDRGKNVYITFSLGFLSGLRYTMNPLSVEDSGNFFDNLLLTYGSGKFFLCFVDNPRFFMDLSLALEANKSSGGWFSVRQDFCYYVSSRCALGLGVGASIPVREYHSNMPSPLLDARPSVEALICFDLFDYK